MTRDRVLTHFLMKIEATSSLQTGENILYLRVHQDLLHLSVVVDDLHHWIIRHLFLFLFLLRLFLFLLLICQVGEVIATKRAEFH